MTRSSFRNPTRRGFLGGAASGIAGAAIAGGWRSSARAAAASVRLSDAGPGTAGSIWRPLLERGVVKVPPELNIEWVLGNPGLAAGEQQVADLDPDLRPGGHGGGGEEAEEGADQAQAHARRRPPRRRAVVGGRH